MFDVKDVREIEECKKCGGMFNKERMRSVDIYYNIHYSYIGMAPHRKYMYCEKCTP